MKTWILVADESRARLFEAMSRNGGLDELGAYAHPEGRLPGRAFATDRRPRAHESSGPARHAIEPQTDPHDKVAQEFARGLAELLDEGRVNHRYEQLILVAPPRFLGQLRSALDSEVAKLVADTLGKNITRATPDEIRAALDRIH